MSDNPMLINPNSRTSDSVQALPVFKGMTEPYPIQLREEPVYFKCTMLNHHMHRPDGKRLAFLFGILETYDEYDIHYLKGEINSRNPFLAADTSDEITNYRMRVDPKGTLTKQITPEIEAKLRVELEVQLRDELEKRLNSVGIQLTEEQKAKLAENNLGASGSDISDSSKLSGTTALEQLKNKFAGGINTGTGTLVMSSDNPNSFQSAVVGSDKIPNTATSGT